MSPEEVTYFQGLGRVFIMNLITLFALCILYGIYIVIALAAVYALIKRGLKNSSCRVQLVLLLAMFAAMLVNIVASFASNLRLLDGYLIAHPDKPLSERVKIANESLYVLSAITTWTGNGSGLVLSIQFIVGDAVVVWRAWALCPRRRKLMIVPLVLLFVSFAMSIEWMIVSTVVYDAGIQIVPGHVLDITAYCTSALSLATNVSATAVIGYQAYCYRKFMKNTFGSSKVATVFAFLAESGAIYCVIQCIVLGLTVPEIYIPNTREAVGQVWLDIMLFASATYPALVVLFVSNQRSLADHTALCNLEGRTNDIGTHISFASSPEETCKNASGGTSMTVDTLNSGDSATRAGDENGREVNV